MITRRDSTTVAPRTDVSCATASPAQWAREEFGQADLNNTLRAARLVKMAALAAENPAGRVTDVFRKRCDRDGAYRFLENDAIDFGQICASARRACIERSTGKPFVFVPVDPSSLNITDPHGAKKMGSVGTKRSKGRGVHVINAIGIEPNGTPLGLLYQWWWTRSTQRVKPSVKRELHEKETRFWLEAMETVAADFKQFGGGTIPWFQLDRGGDFRDLLEFTAKRADLWVTVRATHNRRVADPETRLLWDQLERQPVLGDYEIAVSGKSDRKARKARMRVTAIRTTLILQNAGTKAEKTVELSAVLALEDGTTPEGEKPLRWLLLTNRPVATFEQAIEVIEGYVQRWKVEEFHRVWKSQCNVEETQLEDLEHVKKWATILATVSMRIERLKHLARKTPETPALSEFSPEEIAATVLLRQPKGCDRGTQLTVGQIVLWIAELGSYNGLSSSGGPPGAKCIARGLAKVKIAAQTLINLESWKPG